MTNSGYSQSVFIGNETKFGSAAAINQNIGIVQSISPTETNNFIKLRTLGGTRNYNNIVPGKFEISGSTLVKRESISSWLVICYFLM